MSEARPTFFDFDVTKMMADQFFNRMSELLQAP